MTRRYVKKKDRLLAMAQQGEIKKENKEIQKRVEIPGACFTPVYENFEMDPTYKYRISEHGMTVCQTDSKSIFYSEKCFKTREMFKSVFIPNETKLYYLGNDVCVYDTEKCFTITECVFTGFEEMNGQEYVVFMMNNQRRMAGYPSAMIQFYSRACLFLYREDAEKKRNELLGKIDLEEYKVGIRR